MSVPNEDIRRGYYPKFGLLTEGRNTTMAANTTLSCWLNARGYAKRTQDEIERTVQTYRAWCTEEEISPAHIRVTDAESYREYRSLQKQCAASTVNKELSYLCIYYDYLQSSGLSYANPFRAVEKMHEASRLPKGILTVEETEKLFASIELKTVDDLFFYTCIEMLYATGMRIGELESLSRQSIRLDEAYLAFPDPKAKRERAVPLPEYTLLVLKLYLSHTTQEHPFRRGQHRTLNRFLNDRLKRLCTTHNLPALRCHGLRHTLATHLLKSGADIRQVQEYLGHRRVKNTEVYTRVFPEELLSVLEQNHPREKACV
jgi:site-specific recombinase XerD